MAYFGNRKIRVEASDLVASHGRKFEQKSRGRTERKGPARDRKMRTVRSQRNKRG